MLQHGMNELEWWRARGIADPFALAIEYYQRYLRSKEHETY